MGARLRHETAIIHRKARLGKGVRVGPFSVIGEGVRVGPGTVIHGHVIIDGDVSIGARCEIYPFAAIGLPPQDKKYGGEPTGVEIGEDNVIREYVTVHRGSVEGDGTTTIGNGNYIMAYSHIAHDCKVGNGVTMANAATLAGHVRVFDNVVLGGLAAVHQFSRIGEYAMIGGLTGVTQDVPPYVIASGGRASLYGINVVGLRRGGISDASVRALRKAYKVLFQSDKLFKDALREVRRSIRGCAEVDRLVAFLSEKSRRGTMR
jgi:UDP-N-acetylglucosamine acyltransferase